uniref:Uncharacterized protein n=1 Tax=Trichobilharzia regenti TaxID=157069 RepID=A0AA85J4S2_TRIRE|nr:unnamed protein product [Trichobilharzia regenti]
MYISIGSCKFVGRWVSRLFRFQNSLLLIFYDYLTFNFEATVNARVDICFKSLEHKQTLTCSVRLLQQISSMVYITECLSSTLDLISDFSSSVPCETVLPDEETERGDLLQTAIATVDSDC